MIVPLRHAMALGVALCLAALAPARAGDPFALGEAADDPHRQVLVLLRLPAGHFHVSSDYADSYGDGAGLAARRRVAAGLARAHGLTLVTRWPMPLLGLDCFVMAVPAGRSPEIVAADLGHEAVVAGAEAMHAYGAQGQAGPSRAVGVPAPRAFPNFTIRLVATATSTDRAAQPPRRRTPIVVGTSWFF